MACFQKYFGNILIEIFKLCKDETDYQIHLIFISFMIEILEKFDILFFYSNFFLKILNINKLEGKEKLTLHLDKAIFIDTCFYYFSLKILYIKFCFESNYSHVASRNLSTLREQMAYLKPDNLNRQLKAILNIKMSVMDVEKITPYYMKHDINKILCLSKIGNFNEENNKNGKNLESNVYDKFFIFLNYLKSTIAKYFAKLEM